MADKVKIIGGAENFWLYSEASGYDITHPPTPHSSKVYPRMTLQAKDTQLVLNPSKTALVIIDLQNYFLSPALGRPVNSRGLQAVDKLKTFAIPACRKAGITLLWLNWGLTQQDIDGMPPTIVRGFAVDNNLQGDRTIAGLGADIGPVKLDDGTIVEGGKVLMRDQWNSNVYDPLSSAAEPHDLRVYKNRLSGFWGGTEVEKALESRGIRTLLFAGCNTDQCVAFSLMDAVSKGWDCLLLSDGCATTSPEFAKDMVEYNMGGWGFLLNCRDLADGVHTIETSQGAEVTHVDDGNKTQGDTSQVLQ